MSVKVIVDPRNRIDYNSFYIKGLCEIFGGVIYQSKPFKGLTDSAANLCFIVCDGDKQTKYTISYNDPYNVDKEIYEWCDIYGSVNANFELTPPEFHAKLISLPPSFGIRYYSASSQIYQAISNFIKCNILTIKDYRKFLGRYKRNYLDRASYDTYIELNKTVDVHDNYIFHLSTLWYNNQSNKNDETVNLTRSYFIKACQEIQNIDFEGGLKSQGDRSSNELFKDYLYNDKRMSMDEWLIKSKQSICVFNTPAFWKCHGWKLGEYLALGKCIISTPLFNDLPHPLEHGVNIHYVENSYDSIYNAVKYISEHPEYRVKLERGAIEYWESYGTPIKSLGLLGIRV